MSQPLYNPALEKFLASYIETALWSETDDAGIPFDNSKYASLEFAPETVERMTADCARFIELCAPILDATTTLYPVAHDFWLTRNHHGAGFWDGDYPESIGKALTDLAHSFGECDLYIGDDGKLYL